jgi:ferredoxin
MAESDEKYPDNVSGPYYTTRDCVLCHTCHEMAPTHFAMSSDGDHMVVVLQPRSDEEKALVAEAMEGCPMDAIRDDGV